MGHLLSQLPSFQTHLPTSCFDLPFSLRPLDFVHLPGLSLPVTRRLLDSSVMRYTLALLKSVLSKELEMIKWLLDTWSSFQDSLTMPPNLSKSYLRRILPLLNTSTPLLRMLRREAKQSNSFRTFENVSVYINFR